MHTGKVFRQCLKSIESEVTPELFKKRNEIQKKPKKTGRLIKKITHLKYVLQVFPVRYTHWMTN